MQFIQYSYYGLMVVLLSLSMVFFLLPVPAIKALGKYSVSLKFMAVSYLYLGFYCIFRQFAPDATSIDLLGGPFLLTSILQAHLMSASFINMMNTEYVNRTYLTSMLTPSLFLVVVFIGCWVTSGYHFIPDYKTLINYTSDDIKPDVLVRVCSVLYYISLNIFYIRTYFKEYNALRQRMEETTSDVETYETNLRFLFRGFWLAQIIVVCTFIVMFTTNLTIRSVCYFSILTLYIVVGLQVLRYPKIYETVSDVVAKEEEETEEQHSTTEEKANKWRVWREQIISKDLYKQPGITVSRLAEIFEVSRGALSSTINECEGTNFNTFIKNLRIQAAKQLMKENTELTMAEIMSAIGYTDQANFSRHFKQVEGIPPLEWKKNNVFV